MTDVVFYHYNEFSPDMNMAIDEYFLKQGKGIVIRLYGWNPSTVTIGSSQKTEAAYNISYCHENHIPAVKRSTGGAAVYHKNDITYMFSAPLNFFDDSTVTGSYKKIAEIFLGVFRKLCIPAEFAGTVSREERKKGLRSGVACFLLPSDYEILSEGKKIIGNAQKREGLRMVQHGSIAYHFDFAETADVLNGSEKWLRRKVTSLNCYQNNLQIVDFQTTLIDHLKSMKFNIIERSNPLDDIDPENLELLLKKFPII